MTLAVNHIRNNSLAKSDPAALLDVMQLGKVMSLLQRQDRYTTVVTMLRGRDDLDMNILNTKVTEHERASGITAGGSTSTTAAARRSAAPAAQGAYAAPGPADTPAKTELCHNHIRGTCTWGARCRYKHEGKAGRDPLYRIPARRRDHAGGQHGGGDYSTGRRDNRRDNRADNRGRSTGGRGGNRGRNAGRGRGGSRRGQSFYSADRRGGWYDDDYDAHAAWVAFEVDSTDNLAGVQGRKALGVQLPVSGLPSGHVTSHVSMSALASCWLTAAAPAAGADADGPLPLPAMRRAALASAAAAIAHTAPRGNGVSDTSSADLAMCRLSETSLVSTFHRSLFYFWPQFGFPFGFLVSNLGLHGIANDVSGSLFSATFPLRNLRESHIDDMLTTSSRAVHAVLLSRTRRKTQASRQHGRRKHSHYSTDSFEGRGRVLPECTRGSAITPKFGTTPAC